MKITQLSTILNNVIKETLGDSAVVNEDISSVIDVGKQILDTTDVEKYVNKLIDHIGRVIFVDRPYEGAAPSVMMDGWQFGSILEKIRADIPDSTTNSTWALTNGTDYSQDIFNGPTVAAKFFNSKDVYEIDMSFAERQVRSAFDGVNQLNGFFSMIENRIKVRKTIDFENLILRTINNMIAATVVNDYGTTISSTVLGKASHGKAVNLLYLYNQATGQTLTKNNCLQSLDFLKFAIRTIMLYSDRMATASKLFNIGETVKYTPKNMQHLILLNEFKRSADMYLQSDTFHDEYTRLPNSEGVNFWQGSGTDYSLTSTSSINVTINNPASLSSKVNVSAAGILGVLFDRDALGVCNPEDRVTSHYNAKAEFINNFYKMEAQYFNDYDENFVVFFVEEAAAG